MKFRGALLFSALCFLAGCVSAGAPYGRVGDAELPAELASEAPRVWISGPWIYLDRSAFVTVFEVRAGTPLRAVYPPDSRFRQRRLRSGFHQLGHFFQTRRFSELRRFRGPGDRWASAGTRLPCLSSPVVYRLAIASHVPFRLRELERKVDFAYRPAVGLQFVAHSVTRALDELLSVVLPSHSIGEPFWAADYEAIWICDAPPPQPVPITLVASTAGTFGQARPSDPERGGTGGAAGGDTPGEGTKDTTPIEVEVRTLREGATPYAMPAERVLERWSRPEARRGRAVALPLEGRFQERSRRLSDRPRGVGEPRSTFGRTIDSRLSVPRPRARALKLRPVVRRPEVRTPEVRRPEVRKPEKGRGG